MGWGFRHWKISGLSNFPSLGLKMERFFICKIQEWYHRWLHAGIKIEESFKMDGS